MLIRANRLGVITDNQYQYLMKQMATNNWRKHEPLDDILIKQEPVLLNKSIEILLQNKIFNAKEFMEELAENKLSMKPEEVEMLLNLDKGRDVYKRQQEIQILIIFSNLFTMLLKSMDCQKMLSLIMVKITVQRILQVVVEV